MHIWGKVFGFLFGFMLSRNIIGGLIGAWIGHTFDKGRGLDFNHLSGQHYTDEDRQQCFFDTSFSVMGYIAKANGRVTEQEIAFANAYMDKLGLYGTQRKAAQEGFREGKTVGFPLDARIKKFREICGKRQDLLLLFLEIQIQVAFADGQLCSDERAALHTIAAQLGFSTRQLDQLLEMIIAGAHFHSQQERANGANSEQQLENAYKLLGVSPNDSAKEIKKAYRKLMSQHHPDKLIAKGLPEEMMEVAKQKTQDIQAAYEMINESR